MTLFASGEHNRIDRRLQTEPKYRARTAIGAAVILALLVVSCSAPPDRVALNTLQTLKATADAAMRVTADLYAQGQLTEVQKSGAIAAYDHFAAMLKVSADALKSVGTTAQADAIAQDASKALSELLALLRQIGVKGI